MPHHTDGPDRAWTRRAYVAAVAGSAVSVAGCAGGGPPAGDGESPAETTTPTTDEGDGTTEGGDVDQDDEAERPEGVSAEEFERGPVPEQYRTATSIGGERRDPASLLPKSRVAFAEYGAATEAPAHTPGACCANCDEYIHDRDGDGFGACVAVEGYVDGADWCNVYESLPEPSVPDGLTDEELATATVPEAYRTATSQGGTERDPSDLLSQADVQLTESAAALADGTAPPGQSCGNCEEFVPDQNGDGWGACAAVAGYVAAEDWCVVWEPVGGGS